MIRSTILQSMIFLPPLDPDNNVLHFFGWLLCSSLLPCVDFYEFSFMAFPSTRNYKDFHLEEIWYRKLRLNFSVVAILLNTYCNIAYSSFCWWFPWFFMAGNVCSVWSMTFPPCLKLWLTGNQLKTSQPRIVEANPEEAPRLVFSFSSGNCFSVSFDWFSIGYFNVLVWELLVHCESFI